MEPEPLSSPADRAGQLVELTETESASEAHELAARLRRHGIVAVANAEAPSEQRSDRGILLREQRRPVVLVLAAEHERALDHLESEMAPEGDASRDEIERDLQAAEEDLDAGRDGAEPSRLEAFFAQVWKLVIQLAVALLVGLLALVAWRFLQRMR